MNSAFPVDDLFRTIDARDAARFAAFLTPDVIFRFGNAAPVFGRQDILHAVHSFFSSVRSVEHRVLAQWPADDSLVCEGEVTYTRHDGSRVTLPFVNVFRMRGRLIEDYRVYIDITPLYTPS
jgi:ketosteroid isomerase-like protein